MSDAAPRDSYVVVLVTVPDVACGEKIARALVDERLAACVNRLGPIRSLFRWKGALDAADEQLLLIKSRLGLFARLEARIAQLHPYETPEIVALPIVAGASRYLDWIAAETSP